MTKLIGAATPEAKQLRWDNYFMDVALRTAMLSKDPSTRVGAVLARYDTPLAIISTGYNGFPRGVYDTEQRLNERELKLQLVVHAEQNAILNAARSGVSTVGSVLYLAACDADGKTAWGGPPCVRCAVECIQAGINEIVSRPFKHAPSRWKESIELARAVLAEAGVSYREIDHDAQTQYRTLETDVATTAAAQSFEKNAPKSNNGYRTLDDE